jgi:hypothetical protein
MVPYKTIPSWAMVVPLPGALMYLASLRVGQEHLQATGQRSVVYEQDEGIGFTDTECILSFLLGFCALFPMLSSSGGHTDLPVDPDDRAP